MRGRIKKLADGLYQVIISLPIDAKTGKYKQKWVRVRGSEKAAEKKLTELLYQLDLGATFDTSKLSLGEYLELWLESYKTQISPSAYQSYENIIRNHITPYLGKIKLGVLKAHDVQLLYARELGQGLSARTVRNHHTILRLALKKAVKRGLININVTDAADPPRFVAGEMQTWDTEELNRFLKANEDQPLYPLFYLALFTGMRKSELLGLQWQDIDFFDVPVIG